jgi:hypothetical protein
MPDEIVARLKLLRGNPRPNPYTYTEAERRRFHGGNPDADAYRVLCGFAPTSEPACRGLLGKAEYQGAGRGQVVSLTESTIARLDGRASHNWSDWLLSHPEGFRLHNDGSYTIMTKVKRNAYGVKVGRRPLPQDLNVPRISEDRKHGIVGQIPILPAVVVCAACGRRNAITTPPVPYRYGHQLCDRDCPPILV